MENTINIFGFENYTISISGNVTKTAGIYPSVRKERLLKPCITSGYLCVGLWKNKKGYTSYIHRLLAIHFIPNPDNLPEVNHKDGNKLNNSIENLEWCTHKENMQHAHNNGLIKSPKGKNHHMFGKFGSTCRNSKLDETKVLEIRAIGKTKTLKEISIIYNTSIGLISRVLNRKEWKHI